MLSTEGWEHECTCAAHADLLCSMGDRGGILSNQRRQQFKAQGSASPSHPVKIP